MRICENRKRERERGERERGKRDGEIALHQEGDTVERQTTLEIGAQGRSEEAAASLRRDSSSLIRQSIRQLSRAVCPFTNPSTASGEAYIACDRLNESGKGVQHAALLANSTLKLENLKI